MIYGYSIVSQIILYEYMSRKDIQKPRFDEIKLAYDGIWKVSTGDICRFRLA